MAILTPCRGNVYKVNPVEGADDTGFYRVEGLEAKKGPGDALIIMSVRPTKNDVVLPTITLENTRILYSFGANFGNIVISGMLLLGKSGEPGQCLKSLIDFFDKNRVSVSKTDSTSINVSGPSTSWKVFLTGLEVGEGDSVNNTQSFAMTGYIAEPK